MGEALSPEICVIGGGMGGVTAAITAALHGLPVVLVAKGEIGGGYIQADAARQALFAIARRAADFAEAKTFGLNAARPKVDFYRVRDRIRAVMAGAAANFSAERLYGLGVQVIRGAARFTNRAAVAVSDTQIKPRRFIIAADASPVVPPAAQDTAYLTAETIVDLLVCPKELVVLGATAEGLALAQAYRRLGAEVTIIDPGEALGDFDAECAAIVLREVAREGIELRTGMPIKQIKQARGRVQIIFDTPDEQKIDATDLLLATLRAPDFTALDLAAAGIRQDGSGIIVDRYFRTTNKNVYALGVGVDAAPHVIRKQAELVTRHAIFRRRFRWKAQELPRAVHTEPELAQVGVTEAQARQRSRSVRVLRWPYSENDHAQAEGKIVGHVKAVVAGNDQILGVTIVGAQARELIAPWALALAAEMHISALAGLPLAAPSFAEISRQIAMSHFVPGLAPSRFRRIMAALGLRG